MSDLVLDLDRVSPSLVRSLNKANFESLVSQLYATWQIDRKENALVHYQPASTSAAKVHDSTAMIRGVFGGNRCLPLTAPVLMADGSWKNLGDVAPGDFVIAADPDSRRAVPARVVRTWRSGIKPVYRISFSDGGSFEATPDHKVPMMLGSGRTTTKGKPKRAKKRVLRDYLEPIARRGAVNPSKRISCISPSDIQFEETKLPIHPYLLGAWLGDGSNNGETPRFHNADAEVLDRFRELLRPMNMVLSPYRNYDYGITNAGQQRSARIGGMSFRNRFEIALSRLGLIGCDSYTKFVPACVFGLSRADRMQFLAGLIDTDGGLNSYSSTSKALAEGFVHLMRSVGGKATLTERDADCQTGAVVHYFAVYWRLDEPLPLALPRKQQPLGKRAVDLQRRICREVEFVGYRESGDIEVDHPAHCYVTGDYVIVSNSSKTETALVDAVIQSTGVVPDYFTRTNPDLWKTRLRGPVNGRVICQSLANVLETVILPKLQWWRWSGAGLPGDEKGHFGWIPKMCLIDGDWDKSWHSKTRTLKFWYRNPANIDEVVGESTIQFFSYDQDLKDFTSAHCHWIIMDEPPPEPIYQENKIRLMSANGWMILSMTWPDDPSINVDWLHDEVYEKGTPGPHKQDGYECFELHTTDNRHIDQHTVAAHMSTMDEKQRKVRIYGQQIRFSNRVHDLFTDTPRGWCFPCGEDRTVIEGHCVECESDDTTIYNHVEDFAWNPHWPVVWIIDPHPRKPHMIGYVGVTPTDDWWWIATLECEGDPSDVRVASEDLESLLQMRVAQRLGDPRMLANPSGAQRDRTWGDEFDAAGLYIEAAQSSDVGRGILDQFLRPDPHTRKPRMILHPRCAPAIYQFKRFMWDDWRAGTDKGQKQKVREKYDDYPAIGRYLANAEPRFDVLASSLGVQLGVSGTYRRYPARGVRR